ncbi:MAG: hypothetical protein HYW27_03095 [Candidatus Aenigmarchaeota archaeon]|nr:hypothetical protein [Candidatus Aenigmarchaeota archaeon]
MKKSAVLVVLLLIAGISHALTISGTEDTITVKAGTSKSVPINVGDSEESIVSLGIIDAKPWVSLLHGTLDVRSDTKTTEFIASPYIDTQPSTYRFGIVASSAVSGITKKDIFIRVEKGEIVDVESIRSTGNLVPKGDVEIKIRLRSTRTDITRNIVVSTKIISPAGRVSEIGQTLEALEPDATETVVQTLSLPARAEEGDYEILTTISYNGEAKEKKSSFTVARKAIITETSEKFPLLFGYGKRTSVTNEGNFVKNSHDVEADISPFDAMFMSGDEALSKSGGKFVWRLENVSPGEEKSVVYFVDYSPLFIIVIAIIIAIWAIMFKLRSVRIRKYIIQKKFIDEGEEFTVGIDLKNGTGRKVEHITVTDFVPSVFEFRHEHGPAPKKKKTHMGTELTWNVRDLYPNEERVLSYKIKPVFGVHGELSLPPAKASLRHNNIQIEMKSFSPRLGMVIKEEEEKKRFFGRRRKEE